MAALTVNVLSKATDGTHVGDSLLTDNGTTLTYTGTGGFSAPAFIGTGSGAGYLELVQGAAPSLGTTSVQIVAPASVTSYQIKLPAAASTGVMLGTNAANIETVSFVAPGTNGNVLTSNGTTWTSATAAGGFTIGDTQVAFADGANTPAGDAGFTYNKTTDTVTLAGNVNGGAGTQALPTFTMGAANSGIYSTSPGNNIDFSINNGRFYSFSSNGSLFMLSNSAAIQMGAGQDAIITRLGAGSIGIGGASAGATGNLSLTNLTTTATSSTGTAAIIDASNVLRPLTSSLRFKKNVREWQPDEGAMAAFLSLTPITWDYRQNGEKDVVGFSAEALAKVDRGLVNLDHKGQPYSNREHAMLAYLHAIVKQQQSEIDALKGN